MIVPNNVSTDTWTLILYEDDLEINIMHIYGTKDQAISDAIAYLTKYGIPLDRYYARLIKEEVVDFTEVKE